LGAMRYFMATRIVSRHGAARSQAPGHRPGTIGRMAQEKHYEIAVDTRTQYLRDQSDESSDRYVFSYTITIRNAGNASAQLISRHWIITDSRGQVQEVRGLGVV